MTSGDRRVTDGTGRRSGSGAWRWASCRSRAGLLAAVLAIASAGVGHAAPLVDDDFETPESLAAWKRSGDGEAGPMRDPRNRFDRVLALRSPATGRAAAERPFDAVQAGDFASHLELRFQLLVASPSSGRTDITLLDVEDRAVARLRVHRGQNGGLELLALGRRDGSSGVATRETLLEDLAPDQWIEVVLEASLRDRHFDARARGVDGPEAARQGRLAQRIFFLSQGASAAALRVEASDGASVLVDALQIATYASGNAILHGAFERMEGGVPTGWRAKRGTADHLSLDHEAPFEGRGALTLRQPAASGPRTQLTLPRLRIEAGREYRVRYQFRIDQREAFDFQAISTSLRFLGASGEVLDRIGLSGRAEAPSPFWLETERDVRAPEGAVHLELGLATAAGFAGRVSVDALEVRPLPRVELYAPPESFAFDFVEVGEEATPGFTAVPMDKQREPGKPGDFGWDLSNGPLVGGSKYVAGGPYPSFLQSRAVQRARFSADLPNGRYRVSLFAGATPRIPKLESLHRFVVNDGEIRDPKRSLEEILDEQYFAFVHDAGVDGRSAGLAGHQVFEQTMAPRFRRHDLEVQVRDGLQIDVVRGYLAAVIATPIAQAGAHAALADDLSAQLRENFVARYAERAPTRTQRGARRGRHAPEPDTAYVLFRRHWMTAVEHDSRPDREELATALALRATPGEYEPTTFSIWPRRDLRDVRIEVSALEGPKGARIAASAVRTWALVQKPLRRNRPATLYWLEGTFLPDWHGDEGQGRDLHRDLVQRVWLDAQIPVDAVPGRYVGQVTVRTGDEKIPDTTLPLVVEVRDFSLVRPERLHVLRYGANAILVPYPEDFDTPSSEAWQKLGTRDEDRRTRQLFRKSAIEDLRAHGFRPELKAPWPDVYDRRAGTIRWDERWVEGHLASALNLLRADPAAAGHRLWVDAANAAKCCLLGAFRKGGAKWTRADVAGYLTALYRDLGPDSSHAFGGWPGIYLHGSAEETQYGGPGKPSYDAWLAYLRFVRAGDADHDPRSWGNGPDASDDPFIRSVHTFNTGQGQADTVPHRLVGMPYIGPFHGAVQRSTAEQIREVPDGTAFGLYGARGRFLLGYYLWRVGREKASTQLGVFHEFYNPYYGFPASGWDTKFRIVGGYKNTEAFGEGPGQFATTLSRDGRMVGTWFWEELREGVDDDAYLYTLRHWLDETSGDTRPKVRDARQRGESLLREFASRIAIEPEAQHLIRVDRHTLLYRPVSAETMDAWREELAAATSALVAASRE